MRRKTGIVVSATLLAAQLGSPLSAVPPTLEQLSLMAEYLEEKNVAALRAYLLIHPELLEGDTPLAAELRRFMEETRNLAEYLGFDPSLRENIEQFEEGSSSY